MPTSFGRIIPVALIAAVSTAGCQRVSDKTAPPMAMSAMIPAGADYTAADVAFMQGMIAHHAQALAMTAMAPTHGASPNVRLLCQRITNTQNDEIATMRTWLQDRHQTVPDPKDAHPMMMPGMLTAAQMQQLDQAKDTTFDRLFLTFMIQHHNGALAMVHDLFAMPRAGQASEMFRYASDVDADQRAEIGRMQQMLNTTQRSSAK